MPDPSSVKGLQPLGKQCPPGLCHLRQRLLSSITVDRLSCSSSRCKPLTCQIKAMQQLLWTDAYVAPSNKDRNTCCGMRRQRRICSVPCRYWRSRASPLIQRDTIRRLSTSLWGSLAMCVQHAQHDTDLSIPLLYLQERADCTHIPTGTTSASLQQLLRL